jgi:DNA-directed RNA polymerase subunit N (RpoN/RPB10)
MLPIRCFSCNKILGQYSDAFDEQKINKAFLKKNNIERYCCQKILLTTVDIHSEAFSKVNLNFCKRKVHTEIKKIIIAR